jgi:hypothetical protein
MISIILIALAAICNAVMDICSHHYYYSVLTRFDSKFWNASTSWANKYVNGQPANGRVKWLGGIMNKPVQLTDAWHLFKSLMIVFLISAIPFCPSNEFGLPEWIYYLLVIGVGGTVWNLVFNLFYNRILRK